MDKKRRWLPAVLLILFAAAVFSGFYAVGKTGHEVESVKNLGYYEGYLFGIDVTNDNYYIFKTDVFTGKSRYIRVPRQDGGRSVSVDQIGMTKKENVYVHYEISDENGTENQVVLCDFDRGRLIEQWKISEITEHDYWYLLSEEGFLYVGCRDKENMYQGVEYVLDEETMIWNLYRSYDIPESAGYIYTDAQCLWFSDLDGNFTYRSNGGDTYVAFQNDGRLIQKANTYFLTKNGDLHFTNLDTGFNYVIRGNQKNGVPLLCSECHYKREAESKVGTITELLFSYEGLLGGTVQRGSREVPFLYGDVTMVLETLELPDAELIAVFLKSFAAAAAVLAFAAALLWGLYRLNHGAFPVALQMIMVMIPLAVMAYLLSSQAVEKALVSNMTGMEKTVLSQLCSQYAKMLDPEKFAELASRPADSQDPYLEELSQMRAQKAAAYYDTETGAAGGTARVYYTYCYAYRNEILYSLTESSSRTVPVQYLYPPDVYQAMVRAVGKQEMVYLYHHDSQGKWMSMYLPYKNSDGDVCGIVEVREDVTRSLMEITVQTAKINETLMKWLAVMMGCIVLLVFFELLPLRGLNRNVEAMTNGDLGGQVKIAGHTEVAKIARVFNRMSLSIAGHFGELSEFCSKYAKFVPVKFMEYLGKKDIRFVKLGDYAEERLLIADIGSREFERISAGLTGQDMFDFMNRSLGVLVPVIEENGGVVEQFQSAGALSLFDGSGESGLRAAVSVLERLEAEKMKAGGQPVRFAAGICSGPVRLGIIGADTRMAAAAVSEYRQMAAFLRNMAERYGAGILMTGTAAEQIPDFGTAYHSRTLGYVKILSHGGLEKIYDVYDGDNGDRRVLKSQTKEFFEQGVESFMAGEFQKARSLFVRVLERDRGDLAARRYFYLCETYLYETDKSKIKVYIESY